MLLGNKVRAGSPFTPWFAVPSRVLAVPCPCRPCGCGGMGVRGCSACRLGATSLHPPWGSAAFWAQPSPRGDPRGFGGSGGVVSPAANGGQHEAETPSMGCSRCWMLVGMGCCWVWDGHPSPGCTPRSQVAPSLRCPTRTHVLSRGPRCCWVPNARLSTGFSPGTGCSLNPG